jgi:hypothetical protein
VSIRNGLRGGAFVLIGAALLAPTPSFAGAAFTAAPAPLSGPSPCDDLEATWGIQVVRLFLTSYGHMVDFRYRVVDPVKAKPLFDFRTAAHLVDEASGKALAVPDTPKTGRLRNTGMPEAGRTYFILFQNQADLLEKGDRVSVVIGDFAARDLTVE